jgi:farnesyl-diphosphate farnesyltransferase
MLLPALPWCPKRQDALVERTLLRHILRQVSRSFYLSLVVLPKPVRQQVSLAYLFCRIADTIADTRILPRHKRRQALEVFRSQFVTGLPSYEALEQLQAVLLPHHAKEGERQLLSYLPVCFRLFMQLPQDDRQLIRDLLVTLTRGMGMDLKYFPGETASTARALPDMHALDLYTYYVAGVVGEFWTRMHAAHLPTLRHTDLHALCSLAVSFGKGLQLTNILKDLGKDLDNGRCYLPEKHLEQLRMRVGDLSNPSALRRIRPLIRTLIWYTLDHLDRAYDYIVRLPRRPLRLRLSCMWPLLFAVQTLRMVYQSAELLHPEMPVKISRRVVYRTMFWSLWCLAWPRLFGTYYFRLRYRLTSTLCQGDGPLPGA